MKTSAWLAVALIGSGLAAASPSLAQGRYGGGSYGYDYDIRVAPERDRYESRSTVRRVYRDDDVVTGSIDNCRTIITRKEKPNGDIVTRRVKRC